MTAEEYLGQIPLWTREKNSLEDIRRFLDALGNPDGKLSIIHVAGTNGKGSVCAFLTCALAEAGYSVGTFVSPHLLKVQERFLLNGKPVDEPLFTRAFLQVKAAVDQWMERGFKHPSFFEFLFYMACLLFSWQKVDFWVMETGLGGRLDTTNVVEHPLVSVITSISLDHTQYLGETIEEIAGEKAGIIKPRVPVVYDGNCAAAAKIIAQTAKQRESAAFCVRRKDFSVSREDCEMKAEEDSVSRKNCKAKAEEDSVSKEDCTAKAAEEGRKKAGYQGLVLREKETAEEVKIPFSALYQADNGALAWKTLQVLMDAGYVDKQRKALLNQGMAKTVWPGRMEEMIPGVYLDGAHNPGGIQAFAETAKSIPAARKLVLFGAVGDKAYGEMVALLCREVKPDLAAVAHIQNPRDLGSEALKACFEREHCPVNGFSQAEEALEFLLAQKNEDDVIFCLGSLYLIGELKGYLRKITSLQE